MSRLLNILQLWVACVLVVGNAPVPYVHQHATCAVSGEDSVLESHRVRWHADDPLSSQRLDWHVHFAPLSDQGSGNENWPDEPVTLGSLNGSVDAPPVVDLAPRTDVFAAIHAVGRVDSQAVESFVFEPAFLSTYRIPAPVLLNVVRC